MRAGEKERIIPRGGPPPHTRETQGVAQREKGHVVVSISDKNIKITKERNGLTSEGPMPCTGSFLVGVALLHSNLKNISGKVSFQGVGLAPNVRG